MANESARGAELRASIDKVVGAKVFGWAFDPKQPKRTIKVNILVDGEPAGSAIANIFRNDLLEAAIGTGEHGFVCKVDNLYRDGHQHEIVLLDAATKLPIADASLIAAIDKPDSTLTGSIDTLDHVWLCGHITCGEIHHERVEIVITEAGKMIAEDVTGDADANGRLGFRVRLPKSVCDGQPHAFVAEVEGHKVAAIAIITPFLLTPTDVLANYAGEALKGRLANTASRRYAALQEQVRLLAMSGGDIAGALHDLSVAHEFLVSGSAKRSFRTSFAPFAFPEVDAPTATILVPVHNKFSYTYHCLASLRLMPNAASFEVIVLDDASSDETLDLGEIVSGVRIVRNEKALGFVRNNNEGAKHARGKYLVLLNNDTEVSPHWLDRLIEPFDTIEGTGLVGAKLIFGDGALQEAGGLIWRDGSAWNYGRGGNPHDPRYNFLRETDYCSGACVAIETAFWNELGGFDDDFAPAYYEDTDLAFRVRAAGRRVLYQPLCEITHFEGVSSGTDITKGIKRYQQINQPKFLSRWSESFRTNGMPGANPDVAAERSYGRRVLVIDSEVPQPDRSAGSFAAVQEMRLLQSLGYKVTFLPSNLGHLGRYNDQLAGMGIETIFAPFALTADEFLRDRGSEFDLVYITRYYIARDILPLIRRYAPQAKIVFNNADLHFLRMVRDAIRERSEPKMQDALKVRDEELEVMRHVDLTLSYSEIEHAVIVSHNLDSTKVAKCPWVVERRPDVPGFDDRVDIAFLGGFGHYPNREAVRFFVDEVMPLLRRELPGVCFRVYGSNVPDDFEELESDDVVIEGFIDTVDIALDRCRVFVAPLLTGAGIKGKVLDALAHGVPLVLSPIAAEATGLRDRQEAIIASDPAQWVAAIRSLYTDRAKWEAMSAAALAFVETSYSFERGRALLKDAFAIGGIPALSGPYARPAALPVQPQPTAATRTASKQASKPL